MTYAVTTARNKQDSTDSSRGLLDCDAM